MHVGNGPALLIAAAIATGTLGPSTASSAAEAGTAPVAACPAPLQAWTQIDLYFGRNIGGRGLVNERMFRSFLAEEVTPRFPDGLSVIEVAGQFRDDRLGIVREPTKLLVLLVPDRAAVARKVAAVVDRYKRRFRQRSVLRTERPICLAF
jgi:hypothetical protein